MDREVVEKIKGKCPRCNGERNCIAHGSFEERWEWMEGPNSVNGQRNHFLLQCMGCDTVFYQCNSWDSESWDVRLGSDGNAEEYLLISSITCPEAQEKDLMPDWVWKLGQVDNRLWTILVEIYDAIKGGRLILATIGLRTAFERVAEVLRIDPGHDLNSKISRLLEGGYVGGTEADILKGIAEAGNAAAHRAWAPSPTEYQELLRPLEKFIERIFITGSGAMDIAKQVPPRPPRPAKQKGAGKEGS